MKRLVLLLIAPLAGCASTQSVLSKEPDQIHFTDKQPDDVAFCLATKNNTSALRRADGSSVVLIKNLMGGVGRAYTIWPEGAGSRVEFRNEFGPVIGGWKECVGLKPPS